MHRLRIFCLALGLSTAASAKAPERYLYPVPQTDEICVQTCLSEHEVCLVAPHGEGGRCGDEQRLCVERCDPQMMNTVLTGTVDDRYPRAAKTP